MAWLGGGEHAGMSHVPVLPIRAKMIVSTVA